MKDLQNPEDNPKNGDNELVKVYRNGELLSSCRASKARKLIKSNKAESMWIDDEFCIELKEEKKMNNEWKKYYEDAKIAGGKRRLTDGQLVDLGWVPGVSICGADGKGRYIQFFKHNEYNVYHERVRISLCNLKNDLIVEYTYASFDIARLDFVFDGSPNKCLHFWKNEDVEDEDKEIVANIINEIYEVSTLNPEIQNEIFKYIGNEKEKSGDVKMEEKEIYTYVHLKNGKIVIEELEESMLEIVRKNFDKDSFILKGKQDQENLYRQFCNLYKIEEGIKVGDYLRKITSISKDEFTISMVIAENCDHYLCEDESQEIVKVNKQTLRDNKDEDIFHKWEKMHII
jgi:hypothetical protein